MTRIRVHHVSIPRPSGSEKQTRAFYGELLGLEEIPSPPELHEIDVIWYQLGDTELHLFAEQPLEDPSGRHFCVEVDDLEEMRQRLEQAGYETHNPIPIRTRPRFNCRDPFGNDIEFTTVLGDYRV